MPTRIQLDFANLGIEDYDRVCQNLNFPSDWPDGLLAHGSAEVDGHVRVVDIWESSDHFDRFVDERLGAAIATTLGDRAQQPDRSDAKLHTFYTR